MLLPLLVLSVSLLGPSLAQDLDLTDADLISDIFGQQEEDQSQLEASCVAEGGTEVCSGRGTCFYGVCECEEGYEGGHCEVCQVGKGTDEERFALRARLY